MTTQIIRSAGEFGRIVRAARREADLTQRDLALAAGTGERFIVDLEKGKESVQLGKAIEVARALGIGITMTTAPG